MNHDNILAHLQMCFDCLAPTNFNNISLTQCNVNNGTLSNCTQAGFQ